MPKRQPQPFWRKQTNCWYVQIGKKQIRLSPDEDEAFRQYHALMSAPPEEPQPEPDAHTVYELLDRFLDWVLHNRNKLTYEAYKRRLKAFTAKVPDMPCHALKPYHVTAVMDASGWNQNTKNDFATAIKRAFNWAIQQGIVDKNPVAGMTAPSRKARELVVTPAEYRKIMGLVSGAFKTLLEFAWETGARVQELRILQADHVDLPNRRIVIPPSLSKGGRHRVIYLNDRACEMVAEMPKAGYLLLNGEGRPWTKDAINCAFCRLEKKLGKKYHLGAFRKSYATEALKAGVDTVSVAALLGHSDASMVSKVYGRVQQDPEYMARLANRTRGASASGGEAEGQP